VKNIRHLANVENEIILRGQKLSKDAFFEKLSAATADKAPIALENVSKNKEKTAGEKVGALGRGALAMLTDTENLATRLDGGARDGVAMQLLADDRLACRDIEMRLTKKVVEPIEKAFKEIPADIRKKRFDKVDLDLPIPPNSTRPFKGGWVRQDLWALFLNAGNDGNRQRLRDGNRWTDDQIDKALQQLTVPEAKFLQSILDTTDSLFPELAKVYEKRTGLKLEKVKASPLNVDGETFRGGYFPLKYDARFGRSGDPGKLQEADAVKAVLPNNYKTPFVGSGHTKARVDMVKAPVDLDFGVAPAHLMNVIHDISHGDWVRQAARVMLDKGTQDDPVNRWERVANHALGVERTGQFLPWLRDVANARADSIAAASSGVVEQVGGFLRRRVVGATMVLNVPSYGRHLMDSLLSMSPTIGVKPLELAAALPKVLGEFTRVRTKNPEYQLSSELRYREVSYEDNLRRMFRDIGKKVGLTEKGERLDAMIRAGLDHLNSRTVWTAAKASAESRGLSREDAVKFADDAVRRTLPSGDLGDRAAILRKKNSWVGALMMYGYRSKVYNLNARAWNESPARGAVTTMITIAADTAAAAIALQTVHTGVSLLEDVWHRIALGVTGMYPWVDEITQAAIQGKRADASAAPELRGGFDTYNRIHDLVHKLDDGSATGEDKFWAAVQGATGILGGPLALTSRLEKGVRRLEGEQVQERR
jgi:hypothetical protein